MNSRPPASYLSKAEQFAQDLLARIIESKVEPGQSARLFVRRGKNTLPFVFRKP